MQESFPRMPAKTTLRMCHLHEVCTLNMLTIQIYIYKWACRLKCTTSVLCSLTRQNKCYVH